MTDSTASILFFGLVVSAWVGLIVWSYVFGSLPELLELRRMAKCERNRNRFGELRTRLMTLARAGKTDINGPYFYFMYRSITALMRDPHQYSSVADQIVQESVLATHHKTNAANGNGKSTSLAMTHAERRLTVAFARDLDRLCRDYSTTYRWIAESVEYERKKKEARSLKPLPGIDYAPAWVQFVVGHRKLGQVKPLFDAKSKLIEMGGIFKSQSNSRLATH